MAIGTVRRKFGKYFFILALTLGLGIFIVRIGQWAFAIEAIEVVGGNIQVAVDQKRISRNLLFFPSETIRTQILTNNPWLADVRFQKKFPHTIRIVPTLRDPVAQLQSTDRIVLLDREGMVLANSDDTMNVPRIIMDVPDLHIGKVLTDTRMKFTLSLILNIQDTVTVDTITEYDGTYLLVKSEQISIFIPQDKPVSVSIATLQTLLAGFRIKGRLPAVVDLRFDKPIIKF